MSSTENKEIFDVIIGIDLGTTNSEVALLHKGKPKILTIDHNKIMPSVISLKEDGSVLVGHPAVNNELAAPSQTVRTIKRQMGSEEVITLGGKDFTPEMISSLILQRLKLAAEQFLGHPVSKAVISVPAFFNEKQREATKEAAELTGLEAVRLLNEPTAAALAYTLGKANSECCLVYDLGGGTFDVSVVQIAEGIMEVKASHGDVELGGADFDRVIADKVREQFLSEYQVDLSSVPLSWARVMRASEAAKIRLSTEASAQILEEFIITETTKKALHLDFTITRTDFESLIKPILKRTLISVRFALEMASISAEKLDRVILVGGATYTPLVSELLKEELNIVPQTWQDPSLVVALGASIEAANLSGQPIGALMVDITPHSLGTGCNDQYDNYYNYILIHRNTPIPHTASSIFYKLHESQQQIKIDVYQGESSVIAHNQFLGNFSLEGIGGSSTDICISYTIDGSGLLHVTATDVSSGKKASKTLKRVAKSRVKQANLADLSAIKIEASNLLLEDDKEDFSDYDLIDEDDENEDNDEFWAAMEGTQTDTINPTEEGIKIQLSEDTSVVEKSELLLSKGTLDPSDSEQISSELERFKAGDKEALARLSDLIYYLE